MLKKASFVWCAQSTKVFDDLKLALTSAPVLSLPNFKEKFVVETDASGKGICDVLMQNTTLLLI